MTENDTKRPGYGGTYEASGEDENPPNVLTITSDAELIRDNTNYSVSDMYFPDETGNIAFTVTFTKLHSSKQTLGHRHEDNNELYTFTKGQGIILLNSKAIWIKPNMFVLVPKNVFHKVVNMSSSEDLVFFTYFPDHLKRPDKIKKTSLLR